MVKSCEYQHMRDVQLGVMFHVVSYVLHMSRENVTNFRYFSKM